MKKLTLLVLLAGLISLTASAQKFNPQENLKTTLYVPSGTAVTNAGPLIQLRRDQPLKVQVKVASTNSTTANLIVFFRYSNDGANWTTVPGDWTSLTTVLNGTTAVVKQGSLTNVTYPRFAQFYYATNSGAGGAAAAYVTNIYTGTWDP